jgi:hypothetical protein
MQQRKVLIGCSKSPPRLPLLYERWKWLRSEGGRIAESNCDEVYMKQLAGGLVLVVLGEIVSIILIAPRSDHRVTLCHPLSEVPSIFLCPLQSVYYKIIENFQIGDSKSSKISCGRMERLNSERHDERRAVHASE